MMKLTGVLIKPTWYCQGKGLFAEKAFGAGKMICSFGGTIVPWAKATHRSIQYGVNQWLTPSPEDYGYYLNHCCTPNAGFRKPDHLVALRDINPGEEVVIDYSTVVNMKKWDMKCFCGSPECRGIIVSFQYLPAALQEKYRSWCSFG